MGTIKTRLCRLETQSKQRQEQVPVFGIDYMYGDQSAIKWVSKDEFRRMAERGLVGFYEELAGSR